jgi:hypothetical protein
MKNWKTTLGGVATFAAVLFGQIGAALDNNPATVADWSLLIPAGAICWALIKAADSVPAK